MASIIKGTTPTIRFAFKNVDVSTITTSYLTIKQNKEIIIQHDLSEAIVGEDTLAWTLTQEETLDLKVGKCAVMVNWLLPDGTRGASKEAFLGIEDNHKDEVI